MKPHNLPKNNTQREALVGLFPSGEEQKINSKVVFGLPVQAVNENNADPFMLGCSLGYDNGKFEKDGQGKIAVFQKKLDSAPLQQTVWMIRRILNETVDKVAQVIPGFHNEKNFGGNWHYRIDLRDLQYQEFLDRIVVLDVNSVGLGKKAEVSLQIDESAESALFAIKSSTVSNLQDAVARVLTLVLGKK